MTADRHRLRPGADPARCVLPYDDTSRCGVQLLVRPRPPQTPQQKGTITVQMTQLTDVVWSRSENGHLFGFTSNRPDANGLLFKVTKTGKCRIKTIDAIVGRFLAGGHAPLELDIEVCLDFTSDGVDVTWDPISEHLRYSFGDRDEHAEDAIVERVADIVEQFVADVAECSELVERLDEARSASVVTANQRRINRFNELLSAFMVDVAQLCDEADASRDERRAMAKTLDDYIDAARTAMHVTAMT